MKRPDKLLKILRELKKDLLIVKARNDLTEFGKGELHMLSIIEEYLVL
jgi:hypothetical protein